MDYFSIYISLLFPLIIRIKWLLIIKVIIMYFSVAMKNNFYSDINMFVYGFVLVFEQSGAHMEEIPIYSIIVLIKLALFRSE